MVLLPTSPSQELLSRTKMIAWPSTPVPALPSPEDLALEVTVSLLVGSLIQLAVEVSVLTVY